MEYEYKLKTKYRDNSYVKEVWCILKYRKPGKLLWKSESLFSINNWQENFKENLNLLLNCNDEDVINLIKHKIESVENKEIANSKVNKEIETIVNKFKIKGTIKI